MVYLGIMSQLTDPGCPRIRVPDLYKLPPVCHQEFAIWIVNICLTIVTLGIYSAWAKVRRLRYFYDNTSVAGASFDYHGNPVAILKGRILAVVLIVLAGLSLAFGFKFAMSLNQEFAQLTKVVPGSLEALKEQLRTWPLGSYIVDAFDRAPSLESAMTDWSSRVSTLFSTTFGVFYLGL